MADFGRGIKAGAAGAAAYLILAVILTALSQIFWQLSTFISAAGLSFPLELTGPLALTGSIFGRIVQGVIFGAIFAALYSRLRGSTSIKKGVVFAAFVWVIVLVELIYTTIPQWSIDAGQTVWVVTTAVAGVTVTLPSVSSVLAGIISALAFGALVGFLWDRFRATSLVEAERAGAALLVSFVLGVWMWLSPIVGVIMHVINQGTIVVEPGPMWWVNILITLAAVIGPVGWVLALVAWRKTRRGESGFKWGVAGGVIMALTGIILLPGALAIIGGVLSGRKPAIESVTTAIEL
jgi:hypothetical protein